MAVRHDVSVTTYAGRVVTRPLGQPFSRQMTSSTDEQEPPTGGVDVEEGPDTHEADRPVVPRPTPQFRRRAWVAFQRALDPLSAPRSLPPPRA